VVCVKKVSWPNFNVPHFRSFASVSCIEIIVQVKILILSSVRSNKQVMAPLCEPDYKLVQLHFNSSIYNGEFVKLQFALNDDYNNFSGKIKHVPHFKANSWKIFLDNLCSYVHFRAVSLIHSALQRNAATLRKLFAPFSFNHVTNACSLFISFLSLFFSLS